MLQASWLINFYNNAGVGDIDDPGTENDKNEQLPM